jgi:hypothetical protein
MGNKTFPAHQNRKIAHAAFMPNTYEELGTRALLNNRSIGGEIVDIVEKALKQEKLQQEQQKWPPVLESK